MANIKEGMLFRYPNGQTELYPNRGNLLETQVDYNQPLIHVKQEDVCLAHSVEDPYVRVWKHLKSGKNITFYIKIPKEYIL